jgi:DNA-binding NarL/FixJ family response regulator
MGRPVTDRQREVWHLLAQGLTNKQIARQLNLSPATVKCHVYAMYQRTGAESRIQAALLYMDAADAA